MIVKNTGLLRISNWSCYIFHLWKLHYPLIFLSYYIQYISLSYFIQSFGWIRSSFKWIKTSYYYGVGNTVEIISKGYPILISCHYFPLHYYSSTLLLFLNPSLTTFTMMLEAPINYDRPKNVRVKMYENHKYRVIYRKRIHSSI